MKSNETTNELLTRITRTTRVIRESFDEYDAKILYPHNDINGGISNAAFRRFLRQYDAMWVNFFKMNLFKAALTPELRSVVAQQEQETITIKRMYQVATTAQRSSRAKVQPWSMKSERKSQRPKAKPTMLQLSIDEGPDPELTKPADKAEEITTPDEEDTKQDQAEAPAIPETTITETANTAIFAKSRATDKKNAGRG
jgi:hypothetical protein